MAVGADNFEEGEGIAEKKEGSHHFDMDSHKTDIASLRLLVINSLAQRVYVFLKNSQAKSPKIFHFGLF